MIWREEGEDDVGGEGEGGHTQEDEIGEIGLGEDLEKDGR